MPPTPRDLHVDRMLTNMSVAYMQSRDSFVANRVFPVLPVDHQSDKYRIYPREWWYRTFAAKRAPATESRGVDWVYSEDAYFCEKFSLHADVPDEDVANEDDDLDVMRDASDLVAEQILLKREVDFIDTFLKTGVWGKDVDVSGGTAWSSASTATPLQDVAGEQLLMHSKTGMRGNVIVSSYKAYNQLRFSDQILDRIIYGGGNADPANVTPQILAGLFEVDEFMLAGAVENTADQGQDEDTDFMLNDGLLLAHRTATPSRRRPSAGYTFAWRGAAGSTDGVRTKRFRMNKLDAERVETDEYRDQKVVATELGVFFHNTGG